MLTMSVTSVLSRIERHNDQWGTLLQSFYARAGLPLPHLQKLEADEVPQPYRRLLVHSVDLTPTLEHFYGERLGLTVLSRRQENSSYFREVLLHIHGSQKRVAYGVIRILLENLPEASARRVLQEEMPFGTILHEDDLPHLSWPQAFFGTEPDGHMKRLLELAGDHRLYGRRNVLLDGRRRLLAEVIEVLAPASEPDSKPSAVESQPNGKRSKEIHEF